MCENWQKYAKNWVNECSFIIEICFCSVYYIKQYPWNEIFYYMSNRMAIKRDRLHPLFKSDERNSFSVFVFYFKFYKVNWNTKLSHKSFCVFCVVKRKRIDWVHFALIFCMKPKWTSYSKDIHMGRRAWHKYFQTIQKLSIEIQLFLFHFFKKYFFPLSGFKQKKVWINFEA